MEILVLAWMLPLLTPLSLSTMPLPLILLLLISGVLFQEYAIHFDVSERTPRRRDAACTFYLRFGSRVDGAAMKASARMYEAGKHAYVNQGQVRRTARRKKEEESRLQVRLLDWLACRWYPLRSEERSRGKYY
jgi:hypothetical protein